MKKKKGQVLKKDLPFSVNTGSDCSKKSNPSGLLD